MEDTSDGGMDATPGTTKSERLGVGVFLLVVILSIWAFLYIVQPPFLGCPR